MRPGMASEDESMSSLAASPPPPTRYDKARLAVVCAAYLGAIVLLDLFSKRIERLNSVAAFFPADGLALALLYVVGLRLTPIVFSGYMLSATLLFGVPWPLAMAASAAGCALQAGTVALLRSLVVTDDLRGRGFGGALTDAAEDLARTLDVASVYLLTTSADAFFLSRGYRPIQRSEAPEKIRSTTQFNTLCPDSAVLMTKEV